MKNFARKRWYLFPPLIIVAIAVFGYLTMLLWNYLIPGIFHLTEITFWQALGLLLLSRILFGGSGKHFGHRHDHWRGHLHEKWSKMSPEDREKFFNNMHYERRAWCGTPNNPGKEESTDQKNV